MRNFRTLAISTAALLCMLGASALAQTDSGVRGGQQNTAGYLQYRGIPIPHPPVISPNPTTGATITANELASFNEGVIRAGQLESTCDRCADVTDGSPVTGMGELDPIFPQFHTNSNGLGARHNGDQCLLCHAQPTLGGSGGFLVPNPGQGAPLPAENPLFRLVPNRFGKQNVVPSFEQQFGPIREVRFKFNPDGTRDGGVHQLWVVTGIKTDPTLTNCSLTQPDFASQLNAGNLSFRIPLQMLGLGLIDSIQDREILSNFKATASQRAALGIAGHPNRNGSAKPHPNVVTRTDPDDSENEAFNNPLHILADWMQFSLLMRFTDAPQPDPKPSASAQRGQTVFSAIGCALCHTPQMQTAPVMNSAVLENWPVNLFSDLLLHHMGAGLADDIIQGAAGPDEFRTVPLWGVGQRLFFLHDGRTSELLQAIKQHFSLASGPYPASEANAVVQNFRRLSVTDQQAILDFLRSL